MRETDDIDRLREERRRELLESTTDDGGQTPDEPIHVSGRTALEETVGTYDVVLLEFHADWCGPCQMLAPVLETLAETTDAAVAKVDVDANQQLAGEFQVRGVPTIVLFADGEVVEQVTGARDTASLEALIDRHTGGASPNGSGTRLQ